MPSSDATTVNRWDGTLAVPHGRFVEVAEHVVGFVVLEVGTPEEALEVAAGHPVARFGALEPRELWPHTGGAGEWLPVDGETVGDVVPGESTSLLLRPLSGNNCSLGAGGGGVARHVAEPGMSEQVVPVGMGGEPPDHRNAEPAHVIGELVQIQTVDPEIDQGQPTLPAHHGGIAPDPLDPPDPAPAAT